jgi:cytochrome c553
MRVVLFVIVLAAACGKGDEPPPPTSGSPNAVPETGPKKPRAPGAEINPQAQARFASMCATCHGEDGTGNGPAAPNLSIKPRNYTDPAWQASVTDDQIRQIILLGGQKVGKSPLMPGNADLKDKPEVLDGLVEIIRGFGKKPAQ